MLKIFFLLLCLCNSLFSRIAVIHSDNQIVCKGLIIIFCINNRFTVFYEFGINYFVRFALRIFKSFLLDQIKATGHPTVNACLFNVSLSLSCSLSVPLSIFVVFVTVYIYFSRIICLCHIFHCLFSLSLCRFSVFVDHCLFSLSLSQLSLPISLCVVISVSVSITEYLSTRVITVQDVVLEGCVGFGSSYLPGHGWCQR